VDNLPASGTPPARARRSRDTLGPLRNRLATTTPFADRAATRSLTGYPRLVSDNTSRKFRPRTTLAGLSPIYPQCASHPYYD